MSESNDKPQQQKPTLAAFTWAFIKRRSWLVYSMIFFLIVSCVYLKNVTFNDHQSDASFVKEFINNDDAAAQLSMIGKLTRGVEFEINKNLGISTIHVVPKGISEISGMSFLEFGDKHIFQENDTTFYFYRGESWHRVQIPIVHEEPLEAYNRSPFWYNVNIKTDETMKKVVFNRKSLAIIDENSYQFEPEVLEFSPTSFMELAGDEGDNEVILLVSQLGVVSEKMDSISTIRLYSRLSKSTKDETISRRELPKNVIDYAPYRDMLLLHTQTKGKHSFMLETGERGIALDRVLTDSIVNQYFAVRDISWQTRGEILMIKDENNNLLISDLGRQGKYKFVKSAAIIDFNESFPTAYTTRDGDLWLISDDGTTVGKVNLFNPRDTLSVHKIADYDPELDITPSFSVTDEGLLIRRRSSFPELGEFWLLRDPKVKPDTFKLGSFLSTNLSAYNVIMPDRSPNFEFMAVSSASANATFQIIRGRSEKQIEIVNIRADADKNAPSIIWPYTDPFEVKTNIDYFFGVILLIGTIILYFLGLFYVIDFGNKDVNYKPENNESWNKLTTLKEKVGYARNSMQSLKLRSEIMLWVGLVIGIAGMFAFVLSLKYIFSDGDTETRFTPDFLVRLLRTFGIFSFMELFSFYFLKQYRIVFNEYKRFLSLYLRLMNYYQYIEVVEKFSGTNPPVFTLFDKMRDNIMTDQINMHDESNLEKINEFEKSIASELTKTLASKIPNAT